MNESPIRFRVEQRSGEARRGTLLTAHGAVLTPAFMPVATRGVVKSISAEEVMASGAEMVIMNTYHLWLRPGPELIRDSYRTVHGFSRWPRAIATDSGGFQAFSLGTLCKISEDGFQFSSHLDGSRCLLTPEESLRIQGLLGSDVAMPLDVCLPAKLSREAMAEAMERTTRWLDRSLPVKNSGQALFGIVQGGTDSELRQRHAQAIMSRDVDGLALGGFSVGEAKEDRERTLRALLPSLDSTRPRYLMGVGTPQDIIFAVAMGVDLFDCVLPTRNGRNGQVFVHSGKRSIKQLRYKDDTSVIEPGCRCPACALGYSRGYLRHLFLANEILAHRLLSLHNLQHYGELMAEIRRAIEERSFAAFAERRLSAYRSEVGCSG